MALTPDDRWIWDFWHVQDGPAHHLFYLQAPKSLGDPELRHRNATIGHATSTDLTEWTEHGTVLSPGGTGAIDATATWTGSIVRGDDGLWRMFYTGSTFLSADTTANIEVIALATSTNLYDWTKDSSFALRADAAWYEKLGDSSWPEEAWRDPWVYRDDAGLWHMLITARAKNGDVSERGVVGHATSPDLLAWTVQPPLTEPGAGFAHLEVLQKVNILGQDLAVFSVHELSASTQRRAAGPATGTWIAPWNGRIALEQATNLSGPNLYSGRVIELDGSPVLLAFRIADGEPVVLDGIADPVAITTTAGSLTLLKSEVR